MKTAKDGVEAIRLIRADRAKALAICREIRDSETATNADRLEAIRIIEDFDAKSAKDSTYL